MERPEKIKLNKPIEKEIQRDIVFESFENFYKGIGFNQACSVWEAYHEQEIKIALEHIERLEKSLEIVKRNERTLTKILTEMPSDEELKKILWDIARIEINSQASIMIAEAISQRING